MTNAADRIVASRPEEGVVCLRLNRYAQRNAMDWVMWRQLQEAIGAAREDDDCRAVILTGTDDAFSAGADLRSPGRAGTGVTASAARLEFAGRVLQEISDLRKPTIAAVDGAAIGIGWSLALSCDVVIASAAASFRCAFLRNGVVPDGAILWRLVSTLGQYRAAELIYSDRAVSSLEAAELGLVSIDTGDRPALDAAVKFAERVASSSADATSLSAELIRAAASSTRSEFLRVEWLAAALNFHSEHALAASRGR